MVAWYVLASTLMLGFIAAIWSSKGWLNFILKLAFVAAAVVGSICTAATFGITPA